ncbi:hypothetical protein [Flavobacterium terrigena]|uniref:Uncharacterized protein n=1 Tax=Flavobacterium terrigena TaxID=402734 RepID=A0A1H6S344_9FLAO|nr:hypothetical protein [Flavobacterium terrigena]SEI62568.1 hypothetical protein SAMN05660918_1194 [Flavobacterium terrigena]
MVRIVNYLKRQAEDGREFFVLEISGGIEMIKSQTSNQFYATAKKAFISSTFDEQTCKALIGTEMQGNVVKQDCESYEYVNKDSGEIMLLNFRYVYAQEEVISNEDKSIQKLLAEENTFSTNGHHKEEFVM